MYSRRFKTLCALTVMQAVVLAGYLSPPAAAQDQIAAAKAPVKRVVLFNSGVGYFEHQGQVEGDATIDLKFNVEDVNDLLKSMVLQDFGGGTISTVTYGSRDPITKTLQTFAIDLTSNPTLGELLAQIRGERVELDAPTKVIGTIVGLEKQKVSLGDNETIEVEYLTLLTDEGLRRISLDSIGRIKLMDEQLDDEFRQALAVLASGHATDKKTVTLKFDGEGERDVRVGYIQESPVWKTSYRLVFDDEGEPFLQGWAIVENTTETDWNDVRLSLVSGRPISFVMDLYSPLYAKRPTVVPELYASLRPQVYDQDLDESGGGVRYRRESAATEAFDTPAAAEPAQLAEQSMARRRGGRGGIGGRAAGSVDADAMAVDGAMLQSTVQAAAQGGDVGELFQYDIADEVTLARQRSAMLPIINDQVAAEKVSIYNQSVHAKHPLNGIQLKNTSDLHLMQGPMTVFDGGAYAGDAQIPDLPPGSERLLSYALDLDVEVAPTGDSRPQRLTSVRIEKGVLWTNYQQTRTHAYVVKNSGDQAKRVLIEHPIDAAWKLVAPEESAETTRSVYRFAIDAQPSEPAEFKIEEQRTFQQNVALTNLNDSQITFFLGAQEVSEEIKAALREIVERKSKLAELNRRAEQIQQEIATIGQEQDRIRRNMQSIDRNTDLYNRYVKKFTEQEDQVEKLRAELRDVQAQITAAQQELDEFLKNLELS